MWWNLVSSCSNPLGTWMLCPAYCAVYTPCLLESRCLRPAAAWPQCLHSSVSNLSMAAKSKSSDAGHLDVANRSHLRCFYQGKRWSTIRYWEGLHSCNFYNCPFINLLMCLLYRLNFIIIQVCIGKNISCMRSGSIHSFRHPLAVLECIHCRSGRATWYSVSSLHLIWFGFS